MAEEPLAVDTVGTTTSGVVVTAMRTIMREGMIGWIGGVRGTTITGMTAGEMIEVGSVSVLLQKGFVDLQSSVCYSGCCWRLLCCL